jgi:hypothetical protein
MEFTLYGYFLGDRMAFPVVDYFVQKNWKEFGVKKLMMNANGFFFFKFADHQGMLKVLKGGPWLIRNKPLFLNVWTPTTKLKKEDIKHVAVWVKLHDVPLVAYTEDGLSMMATLLGKPKVLDSYTIEMCLEAWGRSSYARALVEISADQPFKDEILIAIPEEDGTSFTKEKVYVEYEWKPPRCSSCCVFGHVDEVCPKKVKRTNVEPVNKVDVEGFTEVSNKRTAKRQGFKVGKQSQRFEYKPINKSNVNVAHVKPNNTDQASSSKHHADVQSRNPFEILAGKEDRVIEPDELADFAAKLNNDGKRISKNTAEVVEEVCNETSVFMTLGVNNQNKGASTPSRVGINGFFWVRGYPGDSINSTKQNK